MRQFKYYDFIFFQGLFHFYKKRIILCHFEKTHYFNQLKKKDPLLSGQTGASSSFITSQIILLKGH